MKDLFWKISTVILMIACLIVVLDKIQTGMALSHISDRILEKSRVIRENKVIYGEKLDRLKNELRDRERRFHFVLYSENCPDLDSVCCEQTLRKDDEAAFSLAKQIFDTIRLSPRPLDLIRAFHTAESGAKLPPDTCYLDPKSGLLVSRNAAILTHVVHKCGLDARTVLHWDMERGRTGFTMEVFPFLYPGRKEIAAPARFTYFEKNDGKNSGFSADISQFYPHSVIFPFSADPLSPGMEKTLYAPGTKYPLGGMYVYHIRLTSCRPVFLDCSCSEQTDLKQVNLQIIPLQTGLTCTEKMQNRVHSFRITPGADGNVSFLLVGDQACIPEQVSLTLCGDRFPLVR